MRCFLVGLFGLVLGSCADSESPIKLKYFGPNSTEAILTFDSRVQWNAKAHPSEADVKAIAEKQVLHLFGSMAASDVFASPKLNHELSNFSRARLIDESTGLYEATFSYRGTIVLHKGPRTRYEIYLPVNPQTIYQSGFVGKKNRCTDPYYPDLEDFYYFWNPFQQGCPLKEGQHYFSIRGNVERMPNTVVSYPDYPRLVRRQNGRRVVPIILLMGMDDAENNLKDPMVSKDENAKNYRKLRRGLLASGFSESGPWGNAAVNELVGHELRQRPYLNEFVLTQDSLDIRLKVLFTPSGFDENNAAFHWFLKYGIEKESVMIYDGHSGLGEGLNLHKIEQQENFKFQFDKQNYQIFFFNSCSSYPYYNSSFFRGKATAKDPKGIRNLEILTNGLSTGYEGGVPSILSIVNAILDWSHSSRPLSYQKLLAEMDFDTLLGVNGDEDNPTDWRLVRRE